MSKKLLDRVREEIRTRHYNMRAEEAYPQWINDFSFFIIKNIRRRWARGK